MRVEILSTGTELLLGEILNSNFHYLSNKLNELGFDVLYETTVGDNWQRMSDVLKTALNRVDIVITIGGLGPTQGDITKEVTAEVMESELLLDKLISEKIEEFFISRNLPLAKSNMKQAYIPENATVLENERGTAPGIWLEKNNKVIINLPGPPHELKYMFENKVVPLFLQKYGKQGIILSRNLRSIGIGESVIAEKLEDIIKNQANPTIALYASQGEIRIRLTAKADTNESASALIGEMEEQVRARIPNIYSFDEDDLATVLGKVLKQNNFTIAFAESCTGGLASSLLTDVPGSSAYLLGSVVSYSNDAKADIINVDASDIKQYGAVSQPVAEQMATGVAKLFSTDIGVGITGIAGPDGGTEDKPVGTVYISVYLNSQVITHKNTFSGDRKNIKLRTAKMAIFYVLEALKQPECVR